MPPTDAKDPLEARLQEILHKAVDVGASDIHIKSGLPPVVRVGEDLRLLSRQLPAMTNDELQAICQRIVPARSREAFVSGKEIDLAYQLPGAGRFRLNIYRYRGQHIGIVARHIPLEIRSIEELGLPPIVKRLATTPRGLVLVTGATGSGKSTTLASILNELNTQRGGHIVTIEDPIEYLIRDRRAIITQREVGADTDSFLAGLKSALRQDPDVIMIGELRDRETLQTALAAAETGHFVLSTLHTKDALETINRVLGLFGPDSQLEVRQQFAASLSAIISQRLVPRAPPAGSSKSPGLAAAVEVLVNTPFVRSCLVEAGRIDEIREAMEQGTDSYGMQTFDQHLMALLKQGVITRETAIEHATSASDMDLRLRGVRSSDGGRWERLKSTVGPTTDAIDETHIDEAQAGVSSLDMEIPGASLELDDAGFRPPRPSSLTKKR